MRRIRDDVRNVALIGGAGLAGVLATVLVIAATQDRAAGPGPSRDAAPEYVPLGHHLIVKGRTAVGVGTDRTVRLRLNDASGEAVPGPIVYIDGVRIDPSSEALDIVNPDRIDRVEVIKGPAAKTIYGSEAENGVIQVFMKPDQESDNKQGGSGR